MPAGNLPSDGGEPRRFRTGASTGVGFGRAIAIGSDVACFVAVIDRPGCPVPNPIQAHPPYPFPSAALTRAATSAGTHFVHIASLFLRKFSAAASPVWSLLSAMNACAFWVASVVLE
jgi:hypothetical protein